MAKFKYRAMSPSGEKINSEYEANSRSEVIAMITANGYYPLKVEEIQQSKEIEIGLFSKVTLKDISIFCRQFYTMIDAGVTINRALSILANQTPNKKLRQAVRNIEEEVSKGEMLSVSMKKEEGIFPPLLVSMIAVGEMTGNLDQIMLRMADQYEKENKINNKVKVAMTYPAVLAVVAVLVVAVMMTFVMPKFLEIFDSMGTELPLITQLLISSSDFIANNIIIIWSLIIIIGIGINMYFKTEHGTYTLSVLKLKMPVIDKLNQKIIVSRFTRTLSVLLSSGIPMIKALELISEIVGNKLAQNEILSMKDNVVRGEGLYKTVKNSEIFPEMLATMISIGEETGSLDNILYKTADFYDEELESQIQTTAAMIEPLLIVVMGVVIGFIVLAIMIPMTNMYDSI
ncbi:MAG: type II secretion system F family protein [Peptostreptococcaceae bacterium]